MLQVLVLNGPNLNLLGQREPAIYGRQTLADIEARLAQQAADLGFAIECFQSNHEGALIDRIHAAGRDGCKALIMNPGGFTHTSVALRDAVLGVGLPLYEVHLSNIHAREAFRHHSYFTDIAAGSIMGLGALGYSLALIAAAEHLQQERQQRAENRT
ncbi:MAG: type II 3-dehydroquinate dehydratase [Gammaproteobacteria bacterium]|nr:MAG: type II 3-dehydroquinate dehydratase [Gammaproteobacteria bacterium]PIE35180.1 MAG: type II 3-dehydroquinate dehydratase [Gammaproteobacteria bacterium]